MYLLDTNIVSELRRPRPDPRVIQWIEQVAESDLFISAVTIGEIEAGIELTREQDPQKALAIGSWLDQLVDNSQVLSLGANTMRIWGRLMHRKSNTVTEDALIASSAIEHALRVVTRNVSDFKLFGVDVIDPFSDR
jgi:predicted nucleic acid-binding protein